MLDAAVTAFFDAPPLRPAEANRVATRQRTTRLRDDRDPIAGLSEDDERALTDRPR